MLCYTYIALYLALLLCLLRVLRESAKCQKKNSNEMHRAEGCCLISNLLINGGRLELSTFGFG